MKLCRCFPVLALIFVSGLLHAQQNPHKITVSVETPANRYSYTWKIHNVNWGFAVAPVPPTLTSIFPDNTLAKGPAFSLTLNGTNFINASIVQWNGANRATAYMTPFQLTAMVFADDIASAGTAIVTVFNPTPDGGISNPVTFTMNNPVPVIFGLTPGLATVGGPSFTLTVTGTNFVGSSIVQWNGAGRPTTFISSTQITAMISASDFLYAGSANVTVSNPGPGGGTSTANSFIVKDPDNPAPSIANINPNSATAGGAGFFLTVYGSGFISSSIVQWNGNNRNTTFLSATQLTAVIYPNDFASGGTALITVFNPGPGGGISNTQAFIVRNSATPPSATGTATPSSMKAGETVLLVVKVTPGSNPASTGLSVLADVTSIGGSATQRLYDDGTHGDVTPGDNSFSFRATVSANALNGTKTLPIAVGDAQGRSATTTIQLTVVR